MRIIIFKIQRFIFRLFLKLNNNHFSNLTVFSNDCWGGELYKFLDIEYSSPFIGTYLMAPDYIRFLKNPLFYLEKEIEFVKYSKYIEVENARNEFRYRFPVGKINDIEIQFMHFETKEEAKLKWDKRKQRINWQNIIVKFDGSKDLASEKLINEFDQLSFQKKLVLTNVSKVNITSNVYVPDWELDGAKMFLKSIRVFNIFQFLKSKGIKKNLYTLIIYQLYKNIKS
jgi:uncharacterized protein (DUF1919 family)